MLHRLPMSLLALTLLAACVGEADDTSTTTDTADADTDADADADTDADADADADTDADADADADTDADSDADADADTGDSGDTGPLDADGDGSPAGVDCDDADNSVQVIEDWYVDCDADGLLTGTPIGACGSAGLCDGADPDAASTTAPTQADCDDDDGTIGAERSWYLDADNDGVGGATSVVACTAPPDHVDSNGDCNDSDNTAQVTEDWYVDCDGDGFFGDAATASCGSAGLCAGGVDPNEATTTAPSSPDCDDTDSAVQGPSSWYEDGDGDGIGGSVAVSACEAPVDFVASTGDCDDADPTYADPDMPWYADCDGDGAFQGAAHIVACTETDALADTTECNGNDNGDEPYAVRASPPSIPDCDDTDASAADAETPWHADCDGDGFFQDAAHIVGCTEADALTDTTECSGNGNGDEPYAVSLTVSGPPDCDDTDASVTTCE